jgi:SAM-dependent methyltransferase
LKLHLVERDCPLCRCNDFKVFAESTIDESKLTAASFASRKLPEYMHPRMVECNGCKLLYANPTLHQDSLGNAYEGASFDAETESFLAARTYRRLLESHLHTVANGKRAIDIGAFVEQLLDMGFEDVIGVEPSDAPLAAAKPSVRPHLQQGIFSADKFVAESVDLISCFQVMEHLPNPLQLTKETFALLKPGGLFFVVVHNRRALSARILGEKSPIFDVEHLQLFDATTGEQLLRKAGFASVAVSTLKNTYPIDYWIKLFPFPTPLKNALRSGIRRFGLDTMLISIPAGNLALIGQKASQ